jgi:hypothetical protein
MITIGKMIGIFCIADGFCKEFEQEINKQQTGDGGQQKRRNRPSLMSGSEIMTLLRCFEFGSLPNFKHDCLLYVQKASSE